MKKTFNAVKQLAARGYQKATVGAGLAVSSALSFAQTATPTGVDAALDAVDLSGVAVKVGAAALVIVAIALVFKGPDLAKRVIRKV